MKKGKIALLIRLFQGNILETISSLQSGGQILETWYMLAPSPLKQCCNNDSMPPGLLKWSIQHCLWGKGGGELVNKNE